jgi:hypothetical protein
MDGHQIKTAQILGIDRRTLYRRLRQYGYGGSLQDEEEDFDQVGKKSVGAQASTP